MNSHFSSWFDFSGCAPWRGSSPTRRVSWFENISVSTNKSICLFLYFTKEYCIVLNHLKSSIGEVMWLVTRFPCFFCLFYWATDIPVLFYTSQFVLTEALEKSYVTDIRVSFLKFPFEEAALLSNRVNRRGTLSLKTTLFILVFFKGHNIFLIQK